MLKKIMICIFSVLAIIGGTFYITQNNFKNKNDNYVVEDNPVEEAVGKNDDVENYEVINNDLEVTESEKVIAEPDKVIDNTKVEKKESTKKETKKETTKNVDIPKEESVTKTEKVEEEVKPVVKHTCTTSDSGFNKWLQEFTNNNDTSRIFYSKAEAINYGENVGLENGYGYFYNKSAITYEDESCNIDIYAVRLYIPAKTCENDKMMYLKASEEVIHSISYLKKLGYECKDKVER